jgi:hypothetical protein
MDFPRTVDEITPEWLTTVLRESGAIDSASVESFNAETIGASRGNAGLIVRVEMQYDVKHFGAPNTVIAKFAKPDESHRARFAKFYSVETSFFQQMTSDVGMRIPKMYFAECDAVSSFFCLILEDLSHLREVDLTTDCDLEDAQLVMKSLAALHAKWWDRPDLPTWLLDFGKLVEPEMLIERFESLIDPFLEISGDYLPAGLEPVIRRLAPKLPDVQQLMTESRVTLSHVDFKLMNMFFDDDAEGNERLIVYDWQSAARSRGSVDVAEFLMSSFSNETRRKYEAQLLRLYYDQLLEHGVSNFSYDQLEYDLRLGLLTRLFRRVLSTAGPGKSKLATEEGRRTAFTRIERLQIIIDWNCDEVIPN